MFNNMKNIFELSYLDNKLTSSISINHDDWNVFQIEHTGSLQRTKTSQKIINEFQDLLGVYVYEKQGVIYYVGEGKLSERIRQHYTESYRETKRKQHEKWYKFFSSNLGLFNVAWINVEDKYERTVIEAMLTIVLDPEFNKFTY